MGWFHSYTSLYIDHCPQPLFHACVTGFISRPTGNSFSAHQVSSAWWQNTSEIFAHILWSTLTVIIRHTKIYHIWLTLWRKCALKIYRLWNVCPVYLHDVSVLNESLRLFPPVSICLSDLPSSLLGWRAHRQLIFRSTAPKIPAWPSPTLLVTSALFLYLNVLVFRST